MCSFGCGKSYSAKCNLSNHEIKVHNRPKLKNRKSQKPTASPKKQEEEEEKVAQAAVETNDELNAGGDLCNSETGDVIDAEEAKIGGAEELEESNVSLLNDVELLSGWIRYENQELLLAMKLSRTVCPAGLMGSIIRLGAVCTREHGDC